MYFVVMCNDQASFTVANYVTYTKDDATAVSVAPGVWGGRGG